MFIHEIQPNVTVPATPDSELFRVLGAQANAVVLIFENLDPSNTLTWRLQSSPDGTTWTDVASNATLAPGATVAPQVITGQPFYRMLGSGNLTIAVVALVGGVSFNNKFTLLNLS